MNTQANLRGYNSGTFMITHLKIQVLYAVFCVSAMKAKMLYWRSYFTGN